jgi:GNAT superfamily N-acetyltransferase
MSVTIQRVVELPPERLADLVTESEGFQLRLVRRLVDEWISGANRFDRPGEAFFAAAINGRVIGICGLNVDAYTTDPRIGRVRHLYVLLEHRRQRIGTRLVHEVIAAARGNFDPFAPSHRQAASGRLLCATRLSANCRRTRLHARAAR